MKKNKLRLSKTKLCINTTFSNIFVTLIQKKKVLYSFTGGAARETSKNNKRFKISPGTISNLAKKVNIKLQQFGIKKIDVISKVSLRYIIKMFLTQLHYYNIKIININIKIPFTHNGVRGKKLRRT